MVNFNLRTKIAGFTLSNPIFNASGPQCTSVEELDLLQQSEAGAFLSKSATLTARKGNPSPRYLSLPLGSINSMGLPNKGLDYYLAYYKQHKEALTKPFFLSIAGLSLEENLAMLKKIKAAGFNFPVELNLSCPNLPGKPQIGYDFQQTAAVLSAVFNTYSAPLGVKLPPYFDLIHFEEMAAILNSFPLRFVTCINSIGNGLVVDMHHECVTIHPKNGFGGIGGDYIKPTALANVRQFYLRLRKDIQVIGCGGVQTGVDAFEHLLCGASAVQIGTQLMKEEVDTCFHRIINELTTLMLQKNYHTLDDFRGNLKDLAAST